MTLRPPPGRAGRLWLTERLATARRAAGLLEKKQDALRREQSRLTELESRTAEVWEQRCKDADTWSMRALLVGGRDELDRSVGARGEAHARLEWGSEMGVNYPMTARCERPADVETASLTALSLAVAACGRALDAAVEHAAASAALERVTHELAATGRRLRAIRDRLVPALESRLARLEIALDEAEREEVVRLRWAAGVRWTSATSGVGR